MTARKLLEPTRLETTGATATIELEPRSGYGNVKNVQVCAKVHKVKTLNTTTITVGIKQTPDGDANFAKSHSTPINAQTLSAEPALLVGYTDVDTNGPISEYLHFGVTIGGGAGEWAVVELWEVLKPT